MKTAIYLSALLILFTLGCDRRISSSEEPVNHLLQVDWMAFCVMANQIEATKSLKQSDWDSTFFARMHAYRPHARSRVSMAFIDQTDLIGPTAHDYHLFAMYAFEAGGFDFECPALKRILPGKPPISCVECDTDSLEVAIDSIMHSDDIPIP